MKALVRLSEKIGQIADENKTHTKFSFLLLFY